MRKDYELKQTDGTFGFDFTTVHLSMFSPRWVGGGGQGRAAG